MSDLFATQLTDGPGRPVVLSHALGLDHRMWSAWADAQSGRRPVLAYDQPGHGRSAVPSAPITMHSLVDDAERLVSQWQRGHVVWLGLSMGGMVGQGLAIRRPELIGGLVLAHTAARYTPQARQAWALRIEAVTEGGMAAVVDLVVERYLSDDFRRDHPDVAARLREQLLANDPAGYAACCRAVADVDWLDALHRITCPSLVLAGTLDIGATPAMAQAIQQRIPGARLELLKHASHLSLLERPAAFQRAVDEFLQALDAVPRSPT